VLSVDKKNKSMKPTKFMKSWNYSKHTQNQESEVPVLIHNGCKMYGELNFNSDTRLDGEHIGLIESDKHLIIGVSGYVKGFIRAESLSCYGRIEGSIIVSGTAHFYRSSEFFGSIYTRNLSVEDGAIVNSYVNTFDNLNAFEEARLYMAQQISKMYPEKNNFHGILEAQNAVFKPTIETDLDQTVDYQVVQIQDISIEDLLETSSISPELPVFNLKKEEVHENFPVEHECQKPEELLSQVLINENDFVSEKNEKSYVKSDVNTNLDIIEDEMNGMIHLKPVDDKSNNIITEPSTEIPGSFLRLSINELPEMDNSVFKVNN
jgi:cytoskeletal protein CcmA (bactofilin family)